VGTVARIYSNCLLQALNKVSAADMQFGFYVIHGSLNPVAKGGVFHVHRGRLGLRSSAGPRAARLLQQVRAVCC
jgi:hypothetical protein